MHVSVVFRMLNFMLKCFRIEFLYTSSYIDYINFYAEECINMSVAEARYPNRDERALFVRELFGVARLRSDGWSLRKLPSILIRALFGRQPPGRSLSMDRTPILTFRRRSEARFCRLFDLFLSELGGEQAQDSVMRRERGKETRRAVVAEVEDDGGR